MGYQLIETIEVGSGGAASMEFTGIAGTGQDLVCVVSNRGSTNTYSAGVQLNSETSSSYYSGVDVQGDGSSASSSAFVPGYTSPIFQNRADTTANTFASSQIYISNYTSSTDKTISVESISENNGTTLGYQRFLAWSFSTSSAITNLKLVANSGVFVEFTTSSLYMVTA
mgnify:FL=1|jgi:hypothetical protein